MKFNELLDKYSDRKIIKRLMKLYPDQKPSLDGYKQVLIELRQTSPQPSKLVIDIQHYTEDEFGYSAWDSVSGLGEPYPEDPDSNAYGIDYTPWNEWLGMEISKFTSTHYAELDILAHCVWEMTWAGYSSQEVKDSLVEITDRATEALAEIEPTTN